MMQKFAIAVGLLAVLSVFPSSAYKFIACEHQGDKKAVCPPGHYIKVVSAFYGRTDANTCGRNTNTNCRSSKSYGIIKNACQNKNTCVLWPKNDVFGDPCRGVRKYIEMVFECIPARSVIACEHSPDKTVRCPAGTSIQVIDAYYGRDDSTSCGSNRKNTNCRSSSSFDKIKANCHGKNYCVLSAKNSVFGDPCKGTNKYIEMLYKCLPNWPNAQQVFACEHQGDKTITCPAGKYINVIHGYYGRTDPSVCPHKPVDNCYAANSPAIITANCQGERSCVLRPRNSVFGDPCSGVAKYLDVTYECTDRPIKKFTACEHQGAKTMSCHKGTVIQIHRGYYGRLNSRVCSLNRENTCVASGSNQKLRNACQNQQACSINPHNSVFGDPCKGVRKYVEADYACIPYPGNENQIVVCEHQTVKLECPAGKKILILGGFYGRDESYSCNKGPSSNTNCKSASSVNKIYNTCNGKTWCNLVATNQEFGDPCAGTVKFIKAKFACI